MVDDRPPVNITSPGAVPINLEIGKMCVTRDVHGMLHIQPIVAAESAAHKSTLFEDDEGAASTMPLAKKQRDRELLSLQLIMQQLKLDNDALKLQLRTTEKSSEYVAKIIRQKSMIV